MNYYTEKDEFFAAQEQVERDSTIDLARRGIWIMKDGTPISVKEMEGSHLYNCLRLINKRLREEGKIPDITDEEDEDGMYVEALFAKMNMLEREKERRKKEGSGKTYEDVKGATNPTKGVYSSKANKNAQGYYIAKYGKNGTEYLVDRTKTRSKWWTKDLSEAMCFHKQSAASYQKQKLRYGKIEVVKK